eukprot:1191798-Prorocentrum_minimum.AAC.1
MAGHSVVMATCSGEHAPLLPFSPLAEATAFAFCAPFGAYTLAAPANSRARSNNNICADSPASALNRISLPSTAQ